jgi:hypothetical protein
VLLLFFHACSSSHMVLLLSSHWCCLFFISIFFCVGVIVLLVCSCCVYRVCVVALVTFLMLLFSHFVTIFFFFSHGLATFPMLCYYIFYCSSHMVFLIFLRWCSSTFWPNHWLLSFLCLWCFYFPSVSLVFSPFYPMQLGALN